MQDPAAAQQLRQELDRCVKCGMCLAECPTYRLEGSENESPRGRLALIEGLVSGRLQADEALIRHLDNCLTCRRCERVCPSQVRYGHLIDRGRGLLPRRPARRLTQLLFSPLALRVGTRLARMLPPFLSLPVGQAHRLHRLARALPSGLNAPGPGDYPALRGPSRGRVALFPGCTGPALQGGALAAALDLLRYAGFDVRIPSDAGCCGALAQHAGDLERADKLAAHNRAAFAGGYDAVISIATGCGIQLDAYDPRLPSPHRDICRFLLEQGGLTGGDFAPLRARIALHTPCSVENVYRGAGWARGLLALVPELEVMPVGDPGQCCGAAGDHMLRRPQRAAELRRPLVELVSGGGFALLATANVGCAMHLASGLAEAGAATEILHPVEVLARQLAR